jgi:hypothetical protein
VPRFVTLPSGLVVNVALIRRVVPDKDREPGKLTVHFSDQDFTILDASDSDALRNYLRRTGAPATQAYAIRTAIFWIVILAAVVFVWFAVRR